MGGGRSMALLVCESLALQEASRALTEAFVPLRAKKVCPLRHPERSRRISFYGMGSNMA